MDEKSVQVECSKRKSKLHVDLAHRQTIVSAGTIHSEAGRSTFFCCSPILTFRPAKGGYCWGLQTLLPVHRGRHCARTMLENGP